MWPPCHTGSDPLGLILGLPPELEMHDVALGLGNGGLFLQVYKPQETDRKITHMALRGTKQLPLASYHPPKSLGHLDPTPFLPSSGTYCPSALPHPRQSVSCHRLWARHWGTESRPRSPHALPGRLGKSQIICRLLPAVKGLQEQKLRREGEERVFRWKLGCAEAR